MPLPAKQVTLVRNEVPVTFLSATFTADPAVTTAAASIALRETVVRVSTAGTTGTFTLTLPDVSEAKGMSYSFIATSLAADTSVVITDFGTTEQWTDITLNNTPAGSPAAPVIEGVLLFSDGQKWWTISTLGDLTQ